MSRRLRQQRILPGQPNHIVCRGNNRRRLFSYPHDYRTYLRLLGFACEKFGCRVHALCLMANHVHLLITPPSIVAMSAAMKRVNQRYAQIRNERRAGSGKLFEQSFFSEPVITERHLTFCVLYIDANPHRAHLSNRDTYPWSTLALHANLPDVSCVPASLVCPDHWYAGLGRDTVDRGEEFQRHFAAYLAGEFGDEHRAQARGLEPAPASGKRLLRPNGSSAAEVLLRFGRDRE